MREDIILTTATVVARKKYSAEEEELLKELLKPKSKIDVLIPGDMDPEKFDVAITAVSKAMARLSLQQETIFPVLGRLLLVASGNPDLWNKKFDKFEDFRLSLAERFGLGRQTSYDALEYARRWAGVLPPEEYHTVGRVKLKMLSQSIKAGDESKATARKLIDFAKENTATALEEKLDKDLHVPSGSHTGAYLKLAMNKRQMKDATKWFNDPRVHAVCGSDKPGDIFDHMLEECQTEWIEKGQSMIDAAKEAADQQEKENAAAATE